MQDTATFYKEVQKLLKAAGYKYKRNIQSAEEHLHWEKPGKPSISLAGWHGTGNWGTGKVSFELYVDFHSKLVLSDIDDFVLADNAYTMKPEFVKQYQTNMDQAKEIIKNQING